MLIINADHFGATPAVNAAVAQAFALGLVSGATIAANAPAFEAACALARRMGFADRVGIELNLGSGAPLTAALRGDAVFCDAQGQLCYRRHRRHLLTPAQMALLDGEFSAQIARCRERGLALSHAASRDHVHTELAIGLAALRALRRQRVPFIRMADTVHRSAWPKKLYKAQMNVLFRLSGLAGARYFCDLSTVQRLRLACGARGRVVEMMVRPAYRDDGALIDAIHLQALAPALRPLAGDTLLAYRDLPGGRR